MQTEVPTTPLKNRSQETLQKGSVGAVMLTLFLDIVSFSIVFPLFPSMLDYYLSQSGTNGFLAQAVATLRAMTQADGASTTFLTHVLFGGVLGSLYSLLQFFFSSIWGRLSDRYGRRTILLYTIGGTALSYFIWFFSSSFWLFIFSRLLGGIATGNVAVATAAIADVTTKKNRAKGMALVGVAFGLGFLIGPAVGGGTSLIDLMVWFPELEAWGVHPFSVPALAAFLLSGLNFIWVNARFRETLPQEKRRRQRQLHSPSARVRIFSSGNAAIRRTNLVYFIFMVAFSGMEFTLTFLAAERLSYTPADNALMFLFIGSMLIFVQGVLVRKIAPNIREKFLALTGLAIGMVAFGLLAFALSWLPFYSGLALLALAVGFSTPTLSALVSLYSSEEEQGRHLGNFRAAGSLARAFGPIFVATVYWYLGSTIAYLLGMALLLFPIVLIFPLPPPDRHSLSHESSLPSA